MNWEAIIVLGIGLAIISLVAVWPHHKDPWED